MENTYVYTKNNIVGGVGLMSQSVCLAVSRVVGQVFLIILKIQAENKSNDTNVKGN